MKKQKQVFFALQCLVIAILNAQPLEVKVWRTQPPMSILQPQYCEVRSLSATGVRVSRVTEPTLTIYFSAKTERPSPAILVIPGGGYSHIAMTKEGELVAQWLNANGITAAVLKYRLPSDSIMENKAIGPLQDAQEAMRLLRRNASEWHIDPSKIGVLGFSAGGHLASTLCTHFAENVYPVADTTSARPDFSILVYPVISMDSAITHGGSRFRLLGKEPGDVLVARFSNETQISEQTPPAFLVHALDDTVVPVENSLRYLAGLRKFRIPAELRLFQKGGHGFGLATTSSGTEKGWLPLCLHWLEVNGWK